MPTEDARRSEALKRLKAKRDFRMHAGIYLIVNAGLVVIWALSGGGYFWPIWAILGWGVGLAVNAWAVFVERPISEEDVRAEMAKTRPPAASE